MELYIHNIILSYLSETRSKLKLPSDHPILLLFEDFKGQCTEKLTLATGNCQNIPSITPLVSESTLLNVESHTMTRPSVLLVATI